MEERLQKFVKLIEAGSFTKAAVKMHVSQPALTVAIAKLEKELGSHLLLREGHSIKMTEAGRAAFEAGRAQAVVLDDLKADLREISNQKPVVRIGMVDAVASALWIFQKPLAELGRVADVSVIVNDSSHLRQVAARRELDLAVVFSSKNDESGLKEESIGSEILLLVTAPSIADTKNEQINNSRLTDYVSFDQQSSMFDMANKALADFGIVSTPKLQSTSTEVLTRMALAGDVVAFLPYSAVRGHLLTKSLVPLFADGEIIKARQELSIISPVRKRQREAVEVFLAEVKKSLDQANQEAVTALANMKRRG